MGLSFEENLAAQHNNTHNTRWAVAVIFYC
jgi:hypothetical protein